jgi:hypothetical protein
MKPQERRPAVVPAPAARLTALALVLFAAAPLAGAVAPGPIHLGIASAGLGGRDSRYWARGDAGAYHFTNPRQGLAATIASTGVAFSSGVTMRLLSQGCTAAREPVVAARPAAARNRVELVRGRLVEWYVNGPLGIEQGFTVAAPATGCHPGDGLVLELAAGPAAEAGADGRSLAFASSGLRYGGLAAVDASGRALAATLSAGGERVWIQVDTAGARWPVVVDPLFENAKLVASDRAANDSFGVSVAVSGDTIVVGASGDDDAGPDSGSAYVFTQPVAGWSGTLQEGAKLVASNGVSLAAFGASVAIFGDTIVVGGAFQDSGTPTGEAYVFVQPGGGWAGTLTESARLLPSDGASFDNFGSVVAIDGDTVVVGSRGDDDNGTGSGSAYVFVEPGAGWSGTLTEAAKLLASDGAATDSFGFSAGISGDTVVVGALLDDDSGTDSGSAYVFTEPPGGWSGTLGENAKLVAPAASPADLFGVAVALDGATVVVGAPGYDDTATGSGAAFVFVEPGGGWVGFPAAAAKLRASDGGSGAALGQAVDVAGAAILVGAYSGDGIVAGAGAAYRFDEPAGGWTGTLTESAKLVASDGDANSQLGISVGLDGTTSVAGARRAGPDDTGAAYVFAPGLQADVVAVPALGFTGLLVLSLAMAAAALLALRRG